MFQKGTDGKLWRLLLGGGVVIPLLSATLFLSAGRMDYWQGWVFSAFVAVQYIVNILIFKRKPDLGFERIKPGRGVKPWDYVYYGLSLPLYFAIFIFGSLDAGRLGWTDALPVWVYIPAYMGFTWSTVVFYQAMWVNRFFSSMVRIQDERGHRVIQSGPYRYVRHPGYVGGMVMSLAMPVVLGSLWALIPAVAVTLLLVIRTWLEDLTLIKELPGYRDYARRVKYRLIPGLW